MDNVHLILISFFQIVDLHLFIIAWAQKKAIPTNGLSNARIFVVQYIDVTNLKIVQTYCS